MLELLVVEPRLATASPPLLGGGAGGHLLSACTVTRQSPVTAILGVLGEQSGNLGHLEVAIKINL